MIVLGFYTVFIFVLYWAQSAKGDKKMKITQVRNATIIIEYNGAKFLVDPWLMPKGHMEGFDTGINPQMRQPRVDLPFEIEKIVDVDCVIITHVHPDHWDEFAQNALKKDIKVFVQSAVDRDYISSKGFRDVEILSEEGSKYRGITLYKTRTQHGKREIIKPLCESVGMPYDAMGVVFKSVSEKTLYVAGDTIWCGEVQEAVEKYTPDVIVVNACAATVFNDERLIMNIDDIKELIKSAPDSTVVASHMDTVSHLALTRDDLKEFREKNSVKTLLIPDDGETLEF